MPATIIATPGAANANSYVTQAQATTYLTTERNHTELWTETASEAQIASLIWATHILDASFDWNGAKMTVEQALRWPRAGVVDLDGFNIDFATIPALLERATADLALHLLKTDRTKVQDLIGLGFSQVSLGEISVHVDDTSEQELIPSWISLQLKPLGRSRGGKGDRTVPLVRV